MHCVNLHVHTGCFHKLHHCSSFGPYSLTDYIGVGAQPTLGGHQIFTRKYVLKISKMAEFYMILARKIIKIPEFL